MSNIIIQNEKTKLKFNKFPNFDEIELIKYTYPKLKNIIFENVTISDFSLLEIFKDYNLSFIDSTISEYTYPIKLNGTKICFQNTKIDFEKLFFMTNMPNLIDISLLYDSIEGVNLYKPFIHLLSFFPFLERIRLLMVTDITYYDMLHTKEYEKVLISNSNLLDYVNIYENLEFLSYLPYYKYKSNDGLCYISFSNEKSSIGPICNIAKNLWINPKYMIYYNILKYHDIEKVKETLSKLSKYGPDFRKELGIIIMEYDFNKNPLYSWINLSKTISSRLRDARLNSKSKQENYEPYFSHLYSMFGELLYDTKGDYIIVNSRGSVISHFSEDKKTRKLVNNLLPF